MQKGLLGSAFLVLLAVAVSCTSSASSATTTTSTTTPPTTTTTTTTTEPRSPTEQAFFDLYKECFVEEFPDIEELTGTDIESSQQPEFLDASGTCFAYGLGLSEEPSACFTSAWQAVVGEVGEDAATSDLLEPSEAESFGVKLPLALQQQCPELAPGILQVFVRIFPSDNAGRSEGNTEGSSEGQNDTPEASADPEASREGSGEPPAG